MKKFLAIILTFFLFSFTAQAAKSSCSVSEQYDLKNKAGNVKITYEALDIDTGEVTPPDAENPGISIMKSLFRINIANVTEELYVVVKNNINDEEKTYTYDDNNDEGIISFDWDNIINVTNFTIYVYSSEKTGCAFEKYKTLYLITPKFNYFSKLNVCRQEYPEFNLCAEFITRDISRDEFYKQLKAYKKEMNPIKNKDDNDKSKTIIDNIIDFVDDYKYFIIGGVLIIAIGTFIVIRIKTKKQRELGL